MDSICDEIKDDMHKIEEGPWAPERSVLPTALPPLFCLMFTYCAEITSYCCI